MTATLRLSPPAPGPAPGEVRASSQASDPDLAPRWGLEVTLAVVTLAGLVAFHRVFSGSSWVGPVLGTALGVQIVCRLTRRYIPLPLLAGLVDLVAVAALTAWTVVPASTTFGLPLAGTWHVAHDSLMGVAARMQAATVPTVPVTGFLLLTTLGAGIVALSGSWITFRLGRSLPALVPSVAAFVTCCCLGTRSGRDWSVVAEVLAGGGFLLVAAAGERASSAWFAARRRGADRLVGTGVPLVVVAAVAALAVVPFLPRADGHGLFGWRTDGTGSARSVFSPLVSLSTRLLHESDTPVFTVESPVRSYWRLTSLDTFNGTSWAERDTYEGADGKLPGVGAAPKGTRTVTERFRVQSLDSVWLPLAFQPRTVSGAGDVSYDPTSGSLLTAHPTSNGLAYEVTSLQYLDTLSPAALTSAPAVTRDRSSAPYLALPASVPASVRRLARSIVAGKRTEYAKALALQDYFHGPAFHYSLHPPSDGSGDGALETFLFDTRTGYCQQFAGSYAVLARAVGIPTRLAVGFTTGTSVGGDRYQVTDADAHVWPEVWFPTYGWVPFEPTKGAPGAGFAIPGATRYTGNTAAVPKTSSPGRARSHTAPTTVPTTPSTVPAGGSKTSIDPRLHSESPPVGGGSVTRTTVPHARPTAHRRRRSGSDPVLAVLGVLLALVVAVVVVDAVGRRFRWYRRRRSIGEVDPDGRYGPAEVTVVWDELTERLAWHGIRRHDSETPHQFAVRVGEDRNLDGETPFGAHLLRLAEILTAAEFGPSGVSGADLVEAEDRARRLAHVVRGDLTRLERLRILVDPRLAWAPVTVERGPGVRVATG